MSAVNLHPAGVEAAPPPAVSGSAGPYAADISLGPWNPGITSTLPRHLYPRATIFNPANTTIPVREIEDLARYSGLPMQVVTCLSPERLVLHELLVRVMTELTIDDGPLQADLGANFRRIVSTLLDRYLQPLMPDLVAEYAAARSKIDDVFAAELAPRSELASSPRSSTGERTGWFGRLARRKFIEPVSSHDVGEDVALASMERWRMLSETSEDPLLQATYTALRKAAGAVASRQGSIAGRDAVVRRLATSMALNDYASRRIGEVIEPHFFAAVVAEGFRVLPTQIRPIVMNTKGASAAGKSTLRPKQRALAERIGVNWPDFAIISPDIWRKQLLDYGSLGHDRRWAGTLTAHEVEIIDRKLDRYIAARARVGRRTHMLIDRFRFDSFAPDSAEDHATQLLTRFASQVHLFFLITPPEATVERAWSRGERVGRYKAVDDLLAHNVEAFTGMPSLFFRWAASPDKEVHYEFLDNSVPEGTYPRTVAFGRNGDMVVVDLDRLMDIDRFRKINIAATSVQEVYATCGPVAGDNLDFLRECIRRIPRLRLADHASGEVYAEFEAAVLLDWHDEAMAGAVTDEEARTYLRGLAHQAFKTRIQRGNSLRRVLPTEHRTVGTWGGASRTEG